MTALGWSQEDIPEIKPIDPKEESDTTKISLGNDNEIIFIKNTKNNKSDTIIDREEKEVDMHDFTFWAGFELGFTGLMMSDQVKADNPWLDINESKSVVVNFNLIEQKIPLIKHYLGITTGLGVSSQDFVFNDTINLEKNDEGFMTGVSSLPITYDKTKLKVATVKIPVFLEINTGRNPDKNFHISAGVIGGWNYSSLVKQKSTEDGRKVKNKTRGDYNINPLSLEAAARIGYNNLTLFATSNLTSLFENDKGPEVYPFTVGISLIGW